MKTLIVPDLPKADLYTCTDGSEINLKNFLMGLRPAVRALARGNYVKQNASFGFAMAQPQLVGLDTQYVESLWDQPHEFVWFYGGWGSDWQRYVANAVRKMRWMLREHANSTLDLQFKNPGSVLDPVDSMDGKGDFLWGDFPWGGATAVQLGPLRLIGAVSCLTEVQDHVFAQQVLSLLGEKIIAGDNLMYLE